jgi:hypothetical protein
MAGERYGRGMGTAWYVRISLYTVKFNVYLFDVKITIEYILYGSHLVKCGQF